MFLTSLFYLKKDCTKQNVSGLTTIFRSPNFLNNIQGYPQMETSETIVRNFLCFVPYIHDSLHL